jgi:hypothetical protein
MVRRNFNVYEDICATAKSAEDWVDTGAAEKGSNEEGYRRDDNATKIASRVQLLQR